MVLKQKWEARDRESNVVMLFFDNLTQLILQSMERFQHKYTPKSVTKIRAPLQPRGCPKDTAPPCTLTFSCKQMG